MRELLRKPIVLVTIASGFLGVGYLGVDIMGWSQPWAFWLGLCILIVGVLCAGAIYSYAYVLWKRQKIGISDENIRERIKEIREPYATSIVKTLRLMYKRLSLLVMNALQDGLNNKQILKVYSDMEDLLGIEKGKVEAKVKETIKKRGGRDEHIFYTIDKLVRRKVNRIIRPHKLFSTKTNQFLTDLVGIMNDRNIGMKQLKHGDRTYGQLESKLDKERDAITSKMCIHAIDNYLSYSDKLNNILLFTSYGRLTAGKVIPAWVRAKIGTQQEVYNRLMNLLLVEVGALLEQWRLGNE